MMDRGVSLFLPLPFPLLPRPPFDPDPDPYRPVCCVSPSSALSSRHAAP